MECEKEDVGVGKVRSSVFMEEESYRWFSCIPMIAMVVSEQIAIVAQSRSGLFLTGLSSRQLGSRYTVHLSIYAGKQGERIN